MPKYSLTKQLAWLWTYSFIQSCVQIYAREKTESFPFSLYVDEEYGDDKPKKVRTAPREPKHKRSKNSQDDRWALWVLIELLQQLFPPVTERHS